MAGLGGQQPGAVFADLRILPLGKRCFFAVLGRNLLIQYRSARFPRCRQDCLTDHASRFYALEEMERRIIHPVVLIYFKFPFHDPVKMLDDLSVFSVVCRFSFCQGKQGKIRIPFFRQTPEQFFIHSERDPGFGKRFVKRLPVQVFSFSDRRKYHQPGRKLVGRQVDDRLRVHLDRRYLCLLLRILLCCCCLLRLGLRILSCRCIFLRCGLCALLY